jgi:hypothetical protein
MLVPADCIVWHCERANVARSQSRERRLRRGMGVLLAFQTEACKHASGFIDGQCLILIMFN